MAGRAARRGLAAVAIMAALAAVPAIAAPPSPLHVAVPIHETLLSDGMRRYAVPLTVNGREIEAGLDTGSTGLWIKTGEASLPRGPRVASNFGSGTTLFSIAARVALGLGGLNGDQPVDSVVDMRCDARHPDCPASRLPFSRFGMEGDGLDGEGFAAMLGIGLSSLGRNPLIGLGVHRWLIRLPRPGETGPGLLLLNPTDEDLAGFVTLRAKPAPAGKMMVAACLDGVDITPRCAPALFDSGMPFIALVNMGGVTPPAGHTRGALRFPLVPRGGDASIGFAFNTRMQASHLGMVQDPRVPGRLLRLGLLPYFAYDVLYDADRHQLAVRPRPPYAGGAEAMITDATGRR